MQDEFDCMVEDDSEEEVAQTIMGVRKRLGEGDAGAAREVEQRWKGRGSMKVEFRDMGEIEEEGEWEGFGDEEEDGDGDVEMEEAVPDLVPAKKERVEPEVDEEGFVKVTKKKR